MTSLSVEEMIDHPRETVERAQQAPLVLEQNGAPVAVMLPMAEYEAMLADHRAALERYITAFEAEIEEGFAGPFEELTAEVRSEIRRQGPAVFERGSLAVPPGWSPKGSA